MFVVLPVLLLLVYYLLVPVTMSTMYLTVPLWFHTNLLVGSTRVGQGNVVRLVWGGHGYTGGGMTEYVRQ